MSGARFVSSLLVLTSSLVLVTACGGSAGDAKAPSAGDATTAGDGPGQKPRGDGELDSLDALRSKLRSPDGKRELNLAAKGWGAELGRVLGDADTLATLEKLDVSDNDLGPDGASGLLGSSHLGALTVLDLGGNEIGDAGAKTFSSAKLDRLTTLNLSGNGIGPEGTKALAKSKGYPLLSSLDLSMNPVGVDGIKALAGANRPQLTALFLLGSEIGPEGARALAKGSLKLKVLALSGNEIGDAGAKALAGAAKLTSLSTLDLSANGIGDVGAKALASSPHLKGLSKLEMFANELSPAGKAALSKRFGDAVKL